MYYKLNVELINESYTTALSLPATDFEIQDTLDKIRVDSENPRCTISYYHSPLLPELHGARLDTMNIYEVNYLAHRLQTIGENEDEVAVLKAVKNKVIPENTEGEVISIKDLINMTFGLQDVSVVSYIQSDADLGQFVIENEMEDYITELPNNIIEKLDKEVVGATFRKKDGGVIVNGMYIMASEFELPEVYDGETIPEDFYKTDYVFKVTVTDSPVTDIVELESKAHELKLPMSDEEAERTAKLMGLRSLSEASYASIESIIPYIDEDCFDDMKAFTVLNDTARLYKEMSNLDKTKFKAAVAVACEYRQTPTPEQLLDMASHIDEYEFDSTISGENDYMFEYLNRHLNSKINPDLLDGMNAYVPARRILDELHANISEYGLISEQGGTLYALITKDGVVYDDTDPQTVKNAMDKAALENTEGVRKPVELSEFIVEVSAMVEGNDKTPVLDWIEYAAFMVDCQAEGETTLEKELSEIYTSLCYVKNNFDNETLQRTLKSIGCPNEIIFRGILHSARISEETIEDLANHGHLMDGYVPIEDDEQTKLNFIFVDDDEGNMFMTRNPKVDAFGYMKRAASFFKQNNSDYNACLKDDMLCGKVIRHISDPLLREAIKSCFLNGTAIDTIVVYTPSHHFVDEYSSEDYPENIEDIIDYQGFDGNVVTM